MKEPISNFSYINKFENNRLHFSTDESAATLFAPNEKILSLASKLDGYESFEVHPLPSRGLLGIRTKKGITLSKPLLAELNTLIDLHDKDIHIQHAFRDQNNIQRFFVPDTCVVLFDPKLPESEIQIILKEINATILRRQKTPGLYTLQLNSKTSLSKTLEILNQKKEVSYAGMYELLIDALPRPSFGATQILNDSQHYNPQWALDNSGQLVGDYQGIPRTDIKAREAWITSPGGGPGAVTVVTIDSGATLTHEDLVDNLAHRDTNEDWNFIDDTSSSDALLPMDRYGHGTHVAGIISAKGNDKGVIGLAHRTKFIPLKIFNDQGYGTNVEVVEAVNAAIPFTDRTSPVPGEKLKIIINCSFKGPDEPLKKDAFKRALDKNIIVVAAAGNDNVDLDIESNRTYPASYSHPTLLTVAASTPYDTRSPFSNFGTQAQFITAPGSDIYSCYKNSSVQNTTSRYALDSGTSMAAPFVSAAAALLWSKDSYAPASWIVQYLLKTSDNITYLPGKKRLNAFRAVTAPPLAIIGQNLFSIEGEILYRREFDAEGNTGNPIAMTGNAITGDWRGFACMTAHPDGNLYIIQHSILHKVEPFVGSQGRASVISTGFPKYSSITGHSNGNLYVTNNEKLLRVKTTGEREDIHIDAIPYQSAVASPNNTHIYFNGPGLLIRKNVTPGPHEGHEDRLAPYDYDSTRYLSLAPFKETLRAIHKGTMYSIDLNTGVRTPLLSGLYGPTSMASSGNHLFYIQNYQLNRTSSFHHLDRVEENVMLEDLSTNLKEANTLSNPALQQRSSSTKPFIPPKNSRGFSTATFPFKDNAVIGRKAQTLPCAFFPSVRSTQATFSHAAMGVSRTVLKVFKK